LKSLQTCANYYGYDWNGDTDQVHDSLADCRATLFCYQKMNEKEK
jgi:DNA polymerase-3 subunit epsilon